MTERQRVIKKIRFIAEHSVLMAQEWKDVMVQAAEMLEKDGGENMKTYKIKPEFLDLWGEDATAETILTEKDVEDITRGWDKTPADVMDQLIEQE